jgi:hypothetical protein
MRDTLFERPVIILTGMGFPTRIEDVMDAYAVLQDWPVLSRTVAHAMALKACKAALSGEIDAETARSMFEAFARRSDVLAPDDDALIAGGARRTGPFHQGR